MIRFASGNKVVIVGEIEKNPEWSEIDREPSLQEKIGCLQFHQ